MADIFREVDEELQQERAAKLWKRYGGWLITVAIAVVLGVAGNVFWTRYQVERQADLSDRYAAAAETLAEGRSGEAATAFAALASDAGGGYAMLARFREATALAQAGDPAAGAAALLAISADSDTPAPYGDLARVQAVRLQISEVDAGTLLNRLAPALAEDGPWRPLARETEAAIKLQSGDRAGAVEIFKELADDPATPNRLRGRAAEMVRALGG